MSLVAWFIANWSILLNAVIGALVALIALLTIIPGVSAHINFLQKIVDFLKKINIK